WPRRGRGSRPRRPAHGRRHAGAETAGARRNGELPVKSLRSICALPPGGKRLLAGALRRRGLSARAVHRVLRVARTIADLEGEERVGLPHLAEAVRYRILSDSPVETVPVPDG
ncbi:MAG: hypothetical protein ACE5FC_10420, partial [Myxococcota bacterium]